jgi:hypothetical protein
VALFGRENTNTTTTTTTNNSGNGIFKVLVEILIVGLFGALIAWGAATATLDSVKTQMTDVSKWKQDHSVAQAGTEATVSTKLDNIEKLIQEMRKERKEDMKEFLEELKKKRDK